MTDTIITKLNPETLQTIKQLCDTAKKGLADCYSKKSCFENHFGFNNHPIKLNMAWHLRYIIMTQIGIKRWLRFHNITDNTLPDFWKYISSQIYEIKNAGDFALAIWAGVESSATDYRVFADKLTNSWPWLRQACNAVELAWVIQALVRFSQRQSMTDAMIGVLHSAHNKLTLLYNRDTGLFARHNRKNLKEVISRRIACFADQAYSILAMANYGQTFEDNESLEIASNAADTICRLQGPRGQWWWHYNVKKAIVSEEYPVFSVHQDSMAPMALLTIDKAAGTDHSSYIEKGLAWLNKKNELGEMMIIPTEGIIFRNIHRREIGKIYRIGRGALTTIGLQTVHRLTGKNLSGFSVNHHCRPYHLGWILYTWADQLPQADKSDQSTQAKPKLHLPKNLS